MKENPIIKREVKIAGIGADLELQVEADPGHLAIVEAEAVVDQEPQARTGGTGAEAEVKKTWTRA